MPDFGNNVGAAPASKFRGDPLAAMDRLPATLRRALHEAVVEWDPRWVRWELNRQVKAGIPPDVAAAVIAAALRRDDEWEVLHFARCWPARFGAGTPHAQARATILRYDEAARVRAAADA